jgi:hypothetical protein
LSFFPTAAESVEHMWSQWFRRRQSAADQPAAAESVELTLSGWEVEPHPEGLRVWRNADGDVLSLGTAGFALPDRFTESSVQFLARSIAERATAGLIEVRTGECRFGRTAALIYKRLIKPKYVYTGMLIIARPLDPDLVWTTVAGEIGTTGVREAVVTAELMNGGYLTLDEYQRSWAQDP